MSQNINGIFKQLTMTSYVAYIYIYITLPNIYFNETKEMFKRLFLRLVVHNSRSELELLKM